MSVAALVVTYNRINLLKECLHAINSQDSLIDKVLIIDNHSSDGTSEYLDSLDSSKYLVRHMSKNIGGSGGFFEGIKLFMQSCESDYLWLMDDDAIPKETALDKLLKISTNIGEFGFLASNVLFTDNTPAVMNIPIVDPLNWNKSNTSGRFLPVIKSASFVSLLIPRTIIGQVGLPYKEFFIWGDDLEYTSRISSKFTSYFVPDSVVVHKMKENSGVDIVNDKTDRVIRYYYSFRNQMFLTRKKSGRLKIKSLAGMFLAVLRVGFGHHVIHRFQKLEVMVRGIVSGCFFNPSIQYLHRS